MKQIPGLTLFEMSLSTGKITKAIFDTAQVNLNKSNCLSKKLQVDPNKMYVQALNLKNAKRKFEKRAKQIIEQNRKK